jgi:hypothetical protein
VTRDLPSTPTDLSQETWLGFGMMAGIGALATGLETAQPAITFASVNASSP